MIDKTVIKQEGFNDVTVEADNEAITLSMDDGEDEVNIQTVYITTENWKAIMASVDLLLGQYED